MGYDLCQFNYYLLIINYMNIINYNNRYNNGSKLFNYDIPININYK